jgi:hypothetical protein
VITLPIVDRALEELEWCLERGAKTVLVGGARTRHAGTRSVGLPEFDHFWDACVTGIPVSMHASDSSCASTSTTGTADSSCRSSRPRSGWSPGQAAHRGLDGGVGLPRCAVAPTRSPHLDRERHDWVPYLFKRFENTYRRCAGVRESNSPSSEASTSPILGGRLAKMAELCGVDG